MKNNIFEWTVVGAGPAGIASIGKLLDANISPDKIIWVDPDFKVGDFATSWGHVMSNTPVEAFKKFYRHCKSFKYPDNSSFMVEKSIPSHNCQLMIAGQPLNWITEHLTQTVHVIKDLVTSLTPIKDFWQIKLDKSEIHYTKKIILAIGSEAQELSFSDLPTVTLKTALNLRKLRQEIAPSDYVAVFGSAQSAKSVIENLSQVEVKKAILFYRSENSLKRHIGDPDIKHIEMLKMTPKNLLTHVPNATKAIYAIGFNRRHIPIEGLPANYSYDKQTGEIAPGIFGIGIAFPETMPYELGQIEYKVSAIWPFMKRLENILPIWLSA